MGSEAGTRKSPFDMAVFIISGALRGFGYTYKDIDADMQVSIHSGSFKRRL